MRRCEEKVGKERRNYRKSQNKIDERQEMTKSW